MALSDRLNALIANRRDRARFRSLEETRPQMFRAIKAWVGETREPVEHYFPLDGYLAGGRRVKIHVRIEVEDPQLTSAAAEKPFTTGPARRAARKARHK